jgi:ClpP class serine protease
VILSVLGSRIGLPDLDMAMPLPMPRQSATSGQAGIAVIPVVGTLVRRSMGIEAASGLMSYGEIEARWTPRWPTHRWRASCSIWIRPAARPRVCSNWPSASAPPAAIKPIWAHANDAAYSAAFAIAAACQRLTLSQTAGVGSIGVIALHVDQSVKDAKDG